MTKLLAMLAVLALFVLAAPPTSADAQDRRPAARRQRTTVLPTIYVPGRVQQPGAFYVIPRTRPAPEERDLRTGMLREVARTVQRAPF